MQVGKVKAGAESHLNLCIGRSVMILSALLVVEVLLLSNAGIAELWASP